MSIKIGVWKAGKTDCEGYHKTDSLDSLMEVLSGLKPGDAVCLIQMALTDGRVDTKGMASFISAGDSFPPASIRTPQEAAYLAGLRAAEVFLTKDEQNAVNDRIMEVMACATNDLTLLEDYEQHESLTPGA